MASLQFYRAAVSSKASCCKRERGTKRKCPFHCHSDISHWSSELWLSGAIKGVLTVKGHNFSTITNPSVDYNMPNRLIVQSWETSTSRQLEILIRATQTHIHTHTKISQIPWRIQFCRQLLYKDCQRRNMVRGASNLLKSVRPAGKQTISSNVPFNLK